MYCRMSLDSFTASCARSWKHDYISHSTREALSTHSHSDLKNSRSWALLAITCLGRWHLQREVQLVLLPGRHVVAIAHRELILTDTHRENLRTAHAPVSDSTVFLPSHPAVTTSQGLEILVLC